MNAAQTISQSALRLYGALTEDHPPPWNVVVGENGSVTITNNTGSYVMLLEDCAGDQIVLKQKALKQIAHFVNEISYLKGEV